VCAEKCVINQPPSQTTTQLDQSDVVLEEHQLYKIQMLTASTTFFLVLKFLQIVRLEVLIFTDGKSDLAKTKIQPDIKIRLPVENQYPTISNFVSTKTGCKYTTSI